MGKRLSIALAATLSALAVSLAAALPAQARTEMVPSFDGTKIKVNFFPTDSAAGKRAPTVLFGPGWGSAGSTDPEGASDPTVGAVGVGPLRAAGYNVLTWDPRGFGDSEGTRPGRQPRRRGPRRQAADLVRGRPARGEARRQARSARRHDRRLLRRRHPARHRGDRQARRRDRPRHRLALADDEPLQGLDLQGGLGHDPLLARQGRRQPRPPHRQRLPLGPGHRQDLGRGREVVRLARAR